MNINEFNDPKNSLVLFELSKKFDFLIRAYKSKKFPKVLMLSGQKGIGKFTLINHFLSYVYDQNNYDLKNHTIINQTIFYKQYLKNLFPNIIHLSGNNFKSLKVDDIRNLKSIINKTSLSQGERFIILDDIEFKPTWARIWPSNLPADGYDILHDDRPFEAPTQCDILDDMLNIRADGRVVACCYDLTSSTNFGNIMETSIQEIWDGLPSTKFRDDFKTGKPPELCQNCLVMTGPQYLLHKKDDQDRKIHRVSELFPGRTRPQS